MKKINVNKVRLEKLNEALSEIADIVIFYTPIILYNFEIWLKLVNSDTVLSRLA
jgi:hypothetical protein